ALGRREPGRGGRARPARIARHRGAALRADGGPRRARAGLSRARRAGAADPAPALLRGPDAVTDRPAGRHLADARLAPDPPVAGEDPRRDRGRARRAGPGCERLARLGPHLESLPCEPPPSCARATASSSSPRATSSG